MSDDLFKKILGETKELGINEVLLFLNGEPLIFPRLFEWLQLLRERKLTTTLFTNASHLTETVTRRIFEYDDVIREVVFSVAGVDDITYLEMMGLDFKTVYDNIRSFCAMNRGKIPVSATVPAHSKMLPYQQRWRELWGPIVGSRIGYTTMFNFAGSVHDTCEHKRGGAFVPKYCGRLGHLAVLWDGRVALCCMDAEGAVILGDVREETLLQVYNGEVASHYREYHRAGRWDELPLCKDCNMHIVGR